MFHMKQKYNAELDKGGDGMTGDESWKAVLPENIKGWDEVKNAKTSDSFWEQMSNMRSMMGQSIRIPTQDASADALKEFDHRLMEKVPSLMRKPDVDDTEVMDAFYMQMGRPEEEGGYVSPELQAPEGIILQEGLADGFKGIAHKHGLTQKQYEGVVKDYSEQSVGLAQLDLEDHNKGMTELNDEWGMAYDKKVEQADAIRQKFFADVVPDIKHAGAPIIKAFSQLAERFGKEGSDNLIEETKEYTQTLAPNEASERLNEILSNKDHAYWVAHDPAHQSAVDKVVMLTKLANPKMSQDVRELRT